MQKVEVMIDHFIKNNHFINMTPELILSVPKAEKINHFEKIEILSDSRTNNSPTKHPDL